MHNNSFMEAVQDAKTRIQEITIETLIDWQSQQKKLVIIDVREDSEWSQGRLPDAVHISMGMIERDIEKHFNEKDTTMVLYCGGGYRSAIAADALMTMGYKQVYSVIGGFKAWQIKSLPIVLD